MGHGSSAGFALPEEEFESQKAQDDRLEMDMQGLVLADNGYP